jgi:transglutaminase-like putative cysteine protease
MSSTPLFVTGRQHRPVLNAIGRTLIGAILFNALSPLSVLANDKPAPSPAAQRQLQQYAALNQKIEAAKAEKVRTPAERLARDFQQAQDLVRSLHADQRSRAPKAKPGEREPMEMRAVGPDIRIEVERSPLDRLSDERRAASETRLREHLRTLTQARVGVRADFDATRRELQAKKLPAEILARHDQAVRDFEQRAAEFDRAAKAWTDGTDDVKSQALADLDDFFKRYPATRTAAPLDPKKLPWRAPEPTTRQPADTQTAWFQNLWGAPKVMLAQAGGTGTGIGPINFNVPPEPGQAPTETDLAATEDAPISDVVRQQAAALGNNPVRILSWARNTLEWVPSWGSVQGADTTVTLRRGNATDIASATIALLRAAKIPARYVVGTIEVDAAKLQNWVGGASTPEMAIDLLQQGGVAASSVVAGGRIIKVRLEHVWVKAFVNWLPSRGARQGSADQHVNPNGPLNAWVDLDPSFKQYSFSTPLDLNAMPFDVGALQAAATAGAAIDTQTGTLLGLNEPTIQVELGKYAAQAQAYIDSQIASADLSAERLFKQRQIVGEYHDLLPGVLQNKVLLAKPLGALPESMRHAVTVKLRDPNGIDGETLVSYRTSLAALGYKRLGVTYQPTSDADRAVLNAYRSANSLPAYLVMVRPQITVEGQSVAQGPAVRMGMPQAWVAEFSDPRGVNSGEVPFKNVAGDEIVFGINTNGVNPDLVYQRLAAQGGAASAAANLEKGALLYWLECDLLEQLSAQHTKTLTLRLPSVIEMSAPLTTHYFLGIPRSGSYQSFSGDAKRQLAAVAADNPAARRMQYVSAGVQASVLEGSVMDQLFHRPAETSVSATQFLAIAARQGQRIFAITGENLATALPQLSVSEDVKADIVSAVSNGMIAITPEREISNKGYTGLGYILLDPATGAGAYLIDGGRNGLSTPTCEGETAPPVADVGVSSLFAPEGLAFALVPPAGAGATAAEAARIAAIREAIKRAALPLARQVAVTVAPRLLLAAVAVGPAATVIVATAAAVALTLAVIMLAYQIKLIIAEAGIDAPGRTEEDTTCTCKKDPNNPKCGCKYKAVPRRPSYPEKLDSPYERRVDWHHRCADNNSSFSFRGYDVEITDQEGDSITVDAFDEATKTAIEVKTSFKNEEYSPYVKDRWLSKVTPQIDKQAKIAANCKWQYKVITNKDWQGPVFEGLGIDKESKTKSNMKVVKLENCASKPIVDDPAETPDTPVD